ncbi:type I polyketide synthase [Nocardia sp. CNY236]|uniref:type I polyketide synthase n=1 Tax=Nocardia sp. CNY236 TaxID=1169152 RepID=UPI0003F851CE|nr:type I polyketide synthase [Nocardia sp. CNY236]
MSGALTDASGSHPPIAIIGIGCRLPGAANTHEFWQLLLAGRDATSTPPPGRPGTRRGGYLDDVEWFDNEYFAISDREAAAMDPRQRLALEVTMDALDDAGIGYRAGGSNAAVVFGASGADRGTAMPRRVGHDAADAVAGPALGLIASRVSSALDVRGPSLAIDTTGSSSLTAVDLAVRLLADGTAPFAIVGGVELVAPEIISNGPAHREFPSPRGRSTPFDITADGCARSDGCSVVVLQPITDALREGNRVYAQIIASALGSNGQHTDASVSDARSVSTDPSTRNERAQRDILRTAWSRAGLSPRAAGYIECHAAGVTVDDAVEIDALATVAGDGRADPLWIGSLKSNIGHCEAAAGITGLVKTALSIQHGVIAPTINVHPEHPLLRSGARGLRVPTERVDWRDVPASERVAGVSSFGFGGATGHVVLRGVDPSPRERTARIPVLLALTARDAPQVREHAQRAADTLAATRLPLHAFAAGAARRRPERIRAAVLAHDHDDAVHLLRELAGSDNESRCSERVFGPRSVHRHGGLMFLFSGEGGEHATMGQALAAQYPAFADGLAEATEALVAAGGPQIWAPGHGFVASTDARTGEWVQPALFAFHVAMVKLLATWGIRPDAVAGYGAGEVAAAVAGGALTMRDAARVAVSRDATLAHVDGRAAMAVLEAARDDVARLVEPMHREVGIAAVHSPRSVVVSGTPRYVAALLRRATRRGLLARRSASDFAAPHPQVAGMLPAFVAALSEITPLAPRVPVYSMIRQGAELTTAAMNHDYWADNITATADLAATIERASDDGVATVLEISPRPQLVSAVREHPNLRESTHSVTVPDDETGGFLTCVAQLYLAGRAVDWSALGPFHPPSPRQWRRRKFPLPTPGLPSTHAAESAFTAEDFTDHVVRGEHTVPTVFWLRRLLRLAHEAAAAATLVDFVVHERTGPDTLPEVVYHLAGAEKSVRVEVTGTRTLASAQLAADPTPADIVAWMRVVDANRAARHHMRIIATSVFYEELRHRRLEYGPRFRTLRGIAAGTGRALGLLDSTELHRDATLDGCLQVLAAAVFDELPARSIPVPLGVDSVWLSKEPDRHVFEVHASIRERADTELVGDVIATDQHGVPCVAFSGVHIRCVEADFAPGIGERRVPDTPATPIHQETWQARELDSVGLGDAFEDLLGHALVVGATDLAGQLERALGATIPTERIAHDPHEAGELVTTMLAGRTDAAFAVVVCPGSTIEGEQLTTSTGHVLALLQQICAIEAVASMTLVLPWPAATTQATHLKGTSSAVGWAALAGLVRSLQLESSRTIRLAWTDTDPASVPLLRRVVTAAHGTVPDELRLSAGSVATRRFVLARQQALPGTSIDENGTYVVTGGLGRLGSVAVRWLLDAGARDVIVLTRAPRPVPALLDGVEDRLVVMRCDASDRDELTAALDDVRAYGCTIRGVVHAADALEDGAFDTVTARQLARMFSPKPIAASNLIELTAPDETDFVLLFSSMSGTLGAPGHSAYAAADAAVDAVAGCDPDRRIISIGWGLWNRAAVATHSERAGDQANELTRGKAVLSRALHCEQSRLLALDPAHAAMSSPMATRLASMLASDDHHAPMREAS